MPSPEPRTRRWRVLVLSLAVVVIAVVVGRGIYEFAVGLHLLGGAGVEQSDEQPDTSPETGTDDADDAELPTVPPSGVPDGAQAAWVDRVVDGDTIRVRVEEPGGQIEPTDSVRVRLLNIDAPELDHPDRGEDCGAVEATRLVETLTPSGTLVWLVEDVENRDRYDRPLRAVFAHDGTFVNAEVVRRGWAEVVLFEPNDRFYENLLPLEDQARDAERGAWAACDGFPP